MYNIAIMLSFNKYYYSDIKQLLESITTGTSWTDVGAKKYSTEYIASINEIGHVNDVQSYFNLVHTRMTPESRFVIVYYNYLWEPLLKIAEALHLKKKQPAQNWLNITDIKNLLELSHFRIIRSGTRLLFPIYIPVISYLLNKILSQIPFISQLGLTSYVIARPEQKKLKNYTVSVIAPARNEAGNIERYVKEVPIVGTSTEIIFIEGNSKDTTLETIKKIIKKYPKKHIQLYKQKGIGKADAVREGIRHATGDIIIILDTDLSVPAAEINKFYDAIRDGYGEFINGTRMVYPLEKDSMRLLNIFGNKLFSLFFSWILGQRFTDTLCGTKVFFRKDYQRFLDLHKYFGDFDPFGDYELIFGAVKLNKEVVEIPVRYKARTYGQTNISRFKHGLLLLKMSLFAWKKFTLE
jgi:hypothetical protein